MKARYLIQVAKAFALNHWDWCGPLAGFALGWIIGKVL